MHVFKNKTVSFISLSRILAWNKTNSKKVVYFNFNKLFTDKKNNTIDEYRCECGFANKKLKLEPNYDLEQNKFIIIRIEICLTKNNFFLDNVKITDFDPNFVQIPGSNNFYYLKSVILFFPTYIAKPKSGGHYTCLKRVENTNEWLNISDTTSTLFDSFPKYLDNVYILFLEKLE